MDGYSIRGTGSQTFGRETALKENVSLPMICIWMRTSHDPSIQPVPQMSEIRVVVHFYDLVTPFVFKASWKLSEDCFH